MMNKEYKLHKIGKQMPYTTPKGFFDKLEENVWAEVKDDYLAKGIREDGEKCTHTEPFSRAKPSKLHRAIRYMVAAAAVISVIFLINMNLFRPSSGSINDVDQAFSQLSIEDQTYLLYVYQDDIFINE